MSFKAATLVAFAIFSLSSTVHAELQTWRLTATSYQVENGFTPPPFAEVGKTFQIDYVVDTLNPSQTNWDGLFSGAVQSFTVNGITNQAGGYIMAGTGFNAINVWPSSVRLDGIDFISFNNFSGIDAPDVTSALNRFSQSATTSATDLRVDFGDLSVWANPSSFVMLPVPEPTPTLLLLVGLPLVLFRKFGFSKKA